jgi:hypothetical protein
MNPLGWAFTALLFSDPSVRWLTLSPAREAPGWAFVGWLMQRTGSVWRHMEEQPGPFGEEGRGDRNEPDAHDIGTNRAGTTSPASSSTPTRCRACRCCRSSGRWRVGRLLSRLVHHRALGADLPHRCRQSRDGRRPSEDIKADPGAGVPATSGVESCSAAALDGWRRRGTNRRPRRSANRPAALPPITLSAEWRRCGSPSPPEPTPTRSSRRR